jgi:mono/diheme cytochrome c family protein
MKKAKIFKGSFLFLLTLIFLFNTTETNCQQTASSSPAIPDNINKIFTTSCVPCHTSQGGMFSKAKLNFTVWTEYSGEKQKEKAEMIYSVIGKAKMPPKAARETRPDIIPTKEQIELIKKWADSLKADDKK